MCCFKLTDQLSNPSLNWSHFKDSEVACPQTASRAVDEVLRTARAASLLALSGLSSPPSKP